MNGGVGAGIDFLAHAGMVHAPRRHGIALHDASTQRKEMTSGHMEVRSLLQDRTSAHHYFTSISLRCRTNSPARIE